MEITPIKTTLLKIDKQTPIEWLFTVKNTLPVVPEIGQFYQISLPAVGECPISVAGITKDGEELEFLIRCVGRVTKEVFQLKVGASLYFRGPYGHGFYPKDYKGRDLVIAAGGSGVAPVRPLIDYFYNHPDEVGELELLLGFKNQDAVLFGDDLKRWEKKFHTVYCTDVESGLPGFNAGLITKHMDKLHNAGTAKIIVVGPPIMMKFAMKAFLEKGARPDDSYVSFERNMSCGLGICGHCRIDEVYVCIDGPVFRYDKVRDLVD